MTHQLRAAHDCLLIGIGTALADDPRLNVRLAEGADPTPVVLDSKLRLPPNSQVLATHQRAHIFCSEPIEKTSADRLEAAGATIIPVQSDRHSLLDIHAVLSELETLQYRFLMVEGGASVIASFLHERVIDWMVITVAPLLLGGLHVPLTETGIDRWTPTRLRIEGTSMLGPDMVIWGQPSWEAG
jgi:3,4-dihydroxy 2-butanone 4-phosphate synthase/GTP cyclohydrolase II